MVLGGSYLISHAFGPEGPANFFTPCVNWGLECRHSKLGGVAVALGILVRAPFYGLLRPGEFPTMETKFVGPSGPTGV